MLRKIAGLGATLGFCILLTAAAMPARAQSAAGCRLTTLSDPPREVLHCGGGLTIEAEKDTKYRVIDQSHVEVTSHAVLVEVTPGRRGGFQVLTPHAIASVRGTLYAVEVKEGQSDVFVSRGQVKVSNRGTSAAVILGPGEGSDVVPGKPLDAHVWAAERVQKLMARFGR